MQATAFGTKQTNTTLLNQRWPRSRQPLSWTN